MRFLAKMPAESCYLATQRSCARIKQVAQEYSLFADVLGETGGDQIEIALDGKTAISATIAELNDAFESALEKALRTEAATAM